MKYIITFALLMPVLSYAAAVLPAPKYETVVVAPMPDTAPSITHLPPVWLEKVMDTASAVPVVGPVVVTALKWLGVLSSVLTALVTAILAIAMALQKLLPLTKLADLTIKVEAFMNGPIMYWLKFFSIYNAKKEEKPIGVVK